MEDKYSFLAPQASAQRSGERFKIYSCRDMPQDKLVMEILGEAKGLAQQYRAVTGKPLGITG